MTRLMNERRSDSILMTCHHPDLGDKEKFKSSAEDWHWLQIVFCLIFLWWGLLGAVRLPARPHCRYNKQKQVMTKNSAKTPKTQQPSEWCQPLGLAESKQTSWETTKYGKGWPQYMLVKGYLRGVSILIQDYYKRYDPDSLTTIRPGVFW